MLMHFKLFGPGSRPELFAQAAASATAYSDPSQSVIPTETSH